MSVLFEGSGRRRPAAENIKGIAQRSGGPDKAMPIPWCRMQGQLDLAASCAKKKEQSAAGEKQTSKQTRTVQRPYLTGLATRLEEPCRFEATRHARTAEVPTRPSSESRECLACTGSRLAQRTMTSPYIAECSRGRIRTTRPARQDAGESHHAREQPLQSGLLTAKKLFGAPQVAHLSGLVEDGVVACTFKATPYGGQEGGSQTHDSKLSENARLPGTGMSFGWLRLRLHGAAACSLDRRGTMSGPAAFGRNRPTNRSSGSRTAPSRAGSSLHTTHSVRRCTNRSGPKPRPSRGKSRELIAPSDQA